MTDQTVSKFTFPSACSPDTVAANVGRAWVLTFFVSREQQNFSLANKYCRIFRNFKFVYQWKWYTKGQRNNMILRSGLRNLRIFWCRKQKKKWWTWWRNLWTWQHSTVPWRCFPRVGPEVVFSASLLSFQIPVGRPRWEEGRERKCRLLDCVWQIPSLFS